MVDVVNVVVVDVVVVDVDVVVVVHRRAVAVVAIIVIVVIVIIVVHRAIGVAVIICCTGGLMGRNVSLDGGGQLTCCVRETFPDGSGNPIVIGADYGVRGWFFSTGSRELAILATQLHAHVKHPCQCVTNAMSS